MFIIFRTYSPLDLVLSHTNPNHVHAPYLYKTHFNIIFQSTLGLLGGLFQFSDETFVCISDLSVNCYSVSIAEDVGFALHM